jgi:hypothetical protein
VDTRRAVCHPRDRRERDSARRFEVKLRRDTETEQDAHDQLADYLDRLGLSEGWLVLFDLRSTRPWTERLYLRDVAHRGHTLHVVGC